MFVFCFIKNPFMLVSLLRTGYLLFYFEAAIPSFYLGYTFSLVFDYLNKSFVISFSDTQAF